MKIIITAMKDTIVVNQSNATLGSMFFSFTLTHLHLGRHWEPSVKTFSTYRLIQNVVH